MTALAHPNRVDGKPGAPSGSSAAPEGTDPDAVIMSVAASQHGVIARWQLVEAGIPVHAIDYRMRTGRLHPLYRGVYRVGPVRARYEKEMAAVLIGGKAAVLSHRSAAAVWELLPSPDARAPIEVSDRKSAVISEPAVQVHRTRRMDRDEKTLLNGIPITTPARTLLDLSCSVGSREMEQALAVANRECLTKDEELERLLERYPKRPGIRMLRGFLNRGDEPALARSEAESRFLGLVRKARLPGPETNVRVSKYEVDFLWRSERVVVEIDGVAFHSSRGAFEGDRRRDAILAASGFRVLRVTWRQLTEEPEATLVLLAQALARTWGS